MIHTLFFALLFSFQLLAKKAPGQDQILSAILETLPLQGVLKERPDGFVYVDLDDDYIHQLALMLKEAGFEEPPYCGAEDLVGAHISVIYADEAAEHHLGSIAECGKTICFQPKECVVVPWNTLRGIEIESVYLVLVEAPALEQLRNKYGLPQSRHGFHITIGMMPMMH